MNELIDKLLTQRGIITKEERDEFFNPNYDNHLGDPFKMIDMDKAVTRILKAIDKKEHIAFYSDFDADGIPGGALLHDLFEKIGHKSFTNYIPHRDTEGYGFHKGAVKTLSKKKVTLIITVDVGITNTETVVYANKLGIDVIVTDHHIPPKKLPPAIAVINPQRKDETYTFKHLCGTGVAFKLAQAILIRAREQNKKWVENIKIGWEKWLLDLVAIATVSDMMPLIGENRVLVHYGLLVLRKSKRPGIHALCRKLGIQQYYITEDDIGFSIGPRINAASRMGNPEEAFKLLTEKDTVVAESLARELESLNNKRKGRVASIVRELNKHFEDNNKGLVLVAGNPNWNPALLGLAANSIVDTYSKTVCLWGRDGTGKIKGSCRGDGSVNIFEMFEQAKETLTQFGGHAHAGGFSIDTENVHTLNESFDKAYKKVSDDSQNKDKIKESDGELLYSKLETTQKTLLSFAPFGIENKKPIFVCNSVIVKSLKQFGKDKNHFEMQLAEDNNQKIVRAIAFFKTPKSFTVKPKENEKVNVLCTIELSRFAGRVSLELRVIDIV